MSGDPSGAGPVPSGPAVTLDNCADEAIHTPGQIQPHGALLVFDGAGLLVGWSGNAAALLLLVPVLGASVAQLAPSPAVLCLIDDCLADMDAGEAAPAMLDVSIGGQQFDCVVHGHAGRVLVEFELRHDSSAQVAGFALKVHAGAHRLKRQATLPAMLQLAVDQVRMITGFDRVMAYRFRHDDSGDVVAEARLESMPPLLGLRYPAGDIPAQARRLYTLNTLRLISDVNYAAVPLWAAADAAPLDLSQAVLRSVSPVHLEYLRNMGVAASMSVSIVLNGRLWGLLACHHATPRQVPYPVRMACDVLAQVLAASLLGLEARTHTDLVNRSLAVHTGLLERLLVEEDMLVAFADQAPALMALLQADALIATQGGKLRVHGPLSTADAIAIVHTLPANGVQLLQRSGRQDWPAATGRAAPNGKWAGLLGLHFDRASNGWLLALRTEQVETVRWAGRPDHPPPPGAPDRLTPRASFAVWKETVHGQAEPWTAAQLAIGAQLLAQIHRANSTRLGETERARAQLLAMLGHDLRDPLHAIQMAALVLERGGSPQQLGRRIQASSGRMQRMISQVMDLGRMRAGAGLGLHFTELDLVPLLADMVDESRIAHPAVPHLLVMPAVLLLPGDGDRLAQAVGNLIGNALHHSPSAQPVRLTLTTGTGSAELQVRNQAPPIDDAVAAVLFLPFKPGAPNTRNPSGLGLGLSIAYQIASAHGGSIHYHHDAPDVVFTLVLPLA